jgi:signal transduction histidine kinase
MLVRKMCTHARHLPAWKGWCSARAAGLALAIVASGGPEADAALEVTAVVIDGHEEQIPARPAGGVPAAVRVPSNARTLAFRFREVRDSNVMGGDARLRYRLDGRDDTWRDLPAAGRALLWFVDKEGLVIGGLDEPMPGETPGWNGSVETSPYAPVSLHAVAPESTFGVVVSFLSHNGERVVGCLGIDEMQLSCARPGEEPRVLPLSPLKFSGGVPRPQSLPDGWQRVGTRPELSVVRLRAAHESHPILAVEDDYVKRFGNWTVTSRVLPEARSGDTVTLAWTSAHSFGLGGEGVATYEGLAPGTYTFRVAAFRANGDPAGEEQRLQVVVVPPFHQRRDVWAAGALGLVAAGVFAGRTISARRMKRKLEALERAHALERERARIARDLHDEIGAALTEIAMQADAVRHEVADVASPDALQLTDGICRSAVSLVRSVDAIVWAVNPANDTLNRFAAYLVQSTEQFLDAAGLSMRFQVPSPLPETPLAGTIRHRLLLAVREALNNVVKHAQAQAVTLSLRLADGMLAITIEDDGVGFDCSRPPADAEHDGLENMRARMREIGGTCTIDSAPGTGTRIMLRLPWPPVPLPGEASHAQDQRGPGRG